MSQFFLGLLVGCALGWALSWFTKGFLSGWRQKRKISNAPVYLALKVSAEKQAELDWLLTISGSRDMASLTENAYSLLHMVWNEHVQGGQIVIRSIDGTERPIRPNRPPTKH